MLLLLAALALGAEPVLASGGWTWLGPLPPGRDPARDEVVFDPDTCEVEVRAVDLDGGPAHTDVRLARVWVDGGWRWADDWRVVDGALVRPGRAPVPLDGLRFGEETLSLDDAGRVVARVRGARTVEILRAPDGAFVGMRRGPVDVRIDGERGVASDGREVRWRRESGELRSVADAAGVRVVYGYAAGALARIDWADGTAVAVEAGGTAKGRTSTRGVGGTWRCEPRGAGRVALEAPQGAWQLERADDVRTVYDPAGATTRARWAAGRLVGWTDPRGGETRLVRDARGRITEVTDPSGAAWRLAWGEGGLVGLDGPGGAGWKLERDSRGAVSVLTEPSGRASRFGWDRSGGAREVRVGAAGWTTARDPNGRATRLVDPAGSSVELVRGGDGRVSRVRDGGGGEWMIARDGRGAIASLAAPGGARWEIARDALGRPVAVSDPTGATTRWTLREDGLPGRVVVAGRHAWELLWSAAGTLSGVRDPLGRTTGWTRDALGRTTAVHRADGESVRLDRDAAGDLVGVGEGVRVRRDAAGRPLAVEGVGLAWDRDPAGRVVGVTAPGVSLALAREPGGAVREALPLGGPAAKLTRDALGNVVRVDADAPVVLTRDAAGRIVGYTGPSGALAVARDVRGLVARLGAGARAWTLGRDAPGRIVSVDAPGGVRLGVDRDDAGRPRGVRFPDNVLARFVYEADDVAVAVADRDGRALGEVGWSLGVAGAVDRLRVGLTWLLRRDPLGALVVAEAEDRVWSNAPDGVDGPDGAFVRYDARGRPASAAPSAGEQGPWGLGPGELRYETDASGAIVGIVGGRGRVALRYDGLGRLAAWRGPAGEVAVRRDALGRLTALGSAAIEGWEGLLARDGVARAGISGIALAGPGGGTLAGPDGAPIFSVQRGLLGWSPHAPPGGDDLAAGRRLAAGPGLPALGLTDATDPASGQLLGPTIAWPWAPRGWEPPPGDTPFADPDAAATVPWDDAPWAPASPWSDPLALLVANGDLPDGGPRGARAPGLPWLPASFAPNLPAPLPDPRAPFAEDEPLVAWIVAHARAPTRAPDAGDLAAFFLGSAVVGRLDLPPGLAPDLPPELGG